MWTTKTERELRPVIVEMQTAWFPALLEHLNGRFLHQSRSGISFVDALDDNMEGAVYGVPWWLGQVC